MEKGKTKVLDQDVAYWRRLPEGHEQKSYEYLLNAMQSYLDRTQMEKNNQMQRATLQNGGPTAVGALDGTGTSSASGRGTGKGGGKGKGPKKPCYFFNHGGCKNSEAKCKFAHVEVPPGEKANMIKPERREGSPSPSPAAGRGGGATAATPPAAPKLNLCQFHLKGVCKKGDDCLFTHASKEEAERQKKAKAKAKAKAAPKAAAASTGIAIPMVSSD